jgi:hypothetical protein
MIWEVRSSRILNFSLPACRFQGSKRHQIPDPQHRFANLIGEMVLDVLDGLLAGQPVPGDDGGGVDLLLN